MNNQKTKKIIGQVLKSNPKKTIALALTVIIVVVLSLVPPQILKILIDSYLLKGKMEGLLVVALCYMGVLLLIGVFDFIQGLLLTVLGQKLVTALRTRMYEKLKRVNASYYTQNGSGDITSHIINDVQNINSLFSDGVISMVIDCFKIIGIVISIWIFSVKLGVFVLCLIPGIYALTQTFRKRILSAQVKNLVELGKVNNHISESVNNILMIKAFSKEAYMEKKYKENLMSNYKTMDRVNFFDAFYSPLIQVVTTVIISIVLLLSSSTHNPLGISIGMLAASVNLITNLFTPIDNLGMELQSIQKGVSGIQRVDAFLDLPEDEERKQVIDLPQMIKDGIHIKFDGLNFTYDGEKNVLSDIGLEILPRENVAFVGRTGVGKSTLFKLLVGILVPSSGRLLINGIDSSSIDEREKRKLFGYVEQKFSFIRGTIKDQITLRDESITKEQVEEAMKFVGLHDYILSMPDGYDTTADQGSMFSQGQKQLLSIARAIVVNPPILLLDEVTANLDSVTENAVVEVLKRAGNEKTILSVSHRMSSVLHSDRVVLLEDGKVKAIGTPDYIIEHTSWIKNSLDIEQEVE